MAYCGEGYWVATPTPQNLHMIIECVYKMLFSVDTSQSEKFIKADIEENPIGKKAVRQIERVRWEDRVKKYI